MPDKPLSKEIFPNIQSKPPLAQLDTFSSGPITSYLIEETSTHLTTTSFQVVVECDKVSLSLEGVLRFYFTSQFPCFDLICSK